MLRIPPRLILVPFDFSRPSMSAWRHGRALAWRFKGSLEALHVGAVPSQKAIPTRFMEPGPALKKTLAARLRAALGAEAPVHILVGSFTFGLLKTLKTRKPDLIVMGTHGRTALQHWRMGSLAGDVACLSPVPVLIVRDDPRPIRRVLAPVNFTAYSERGFLYAAELAAALKARLTVLNVSDDGLPEAETRRRLADLARRAPKGASAEARLARGEAAKTILEIGLKHDLIVLTAHKKPHLTEMILGMTAERVIRHSPVPVLTVPSPAA